MNSPRLTWRDVLEGVCAAAILVAIFVALYLLAVLIYDGSASSFSNYY